MLEDEAPDIFFADEINVAVLLFPTRRAAGLCAVHGIAMAHHEEPQIATHLLAGVAHGTYVECFPDPERDPLWASFILNRAPIKEGIISVPQGPGFGLELDWNLVEKYRLDR